MSEETSDTQTPQDDGRGTAIPGCFILGAIVTVFGGLIILFTVVHHVQKNAHKGFTGDEPAKIPIHEPTEAQIKQLQEKFFAIKAATSQSKDERILLTKDDMNTMLASVEILADFKGYAYIERITDQGIETKMAQPMRKMIFSSERRYLNAVFVFQPELRRRTIAMRVRDIRSDVGFVPDAFVASYDAITFFKIDPENPHIKPIIPRLKRVYTENGHVVIETGTPTVDPALPPPRS